MIQKARISQILDILRLIKIGSGSGQLLLRSDGDVAAAIDNFFVYTCNGQVVGCCQLDIYNKKLAEIRSLSVHPQFQNQGIGSKLVKRCLAQARNRGIYEVLAITTESRLFGRLGFKKELISGKQPMLAKL